MPILMDLCMHACTKVHGPLISVGKINYRNILVLHIRNQNLLPHLAVLQVYICIYCDIICLLLF